VTWSGPREDCRGDLMRARHRLSKLADSHVPPGVPRAQISRQDAADTAVRGHLEGHLDRYRGDPTPGRDDFNKETGDVLFSCSLVVIIIAVIPWRHTWRRYIQAADDHPVHHGEGLGLQE